MISVLTPTHGINVVLDQRQLSSRVPLVLFVFKVWVPYPANAISATGPKSNPNTNHCLELWPFNLATSSAQTEQANAMATIQIQ